MAAAAGTVRFTADTVKLKKILKQLKDAGQSPIPAFESFARHMRTIPALSVAEQRDPSTGRAWRPIAGGHRAGQPALYNTGAMVRSYSGGRITTTSRSVTLTPTPLRKWYKAHQHGATIKPIRSKYLAIPLNDDARRAGSARKWWKQAESMGFKPFVLTSKRGNKLICYAPTRGQLRPMFVLKRLIKIPKRPFLGFGKRDRDLVFQIFRRYLRAAMLFRGGAR